MIELVLIGPWVLSAYPDWCSDPGGDDDESYPPHLNETEESDAE